MSLLQSGAYAIEPRAWDDFKARARSFEQAATARLADIEPGSRAGRDEIGAPATYEIVNGVAVIPVQGQIFSEHSLMNDLYAYVYGGTFTPDIAAMARSAKQDPNVKSVAMPVNSPGGSAFGLSDASAAVADLAKSKKVVAVVQGMAASAGYFIPSGATEIVVSPESLVGSIGTVIEFDNYDKAMEAMGIEEFAVWSKQSPKKRVDEMTPEGRAEYQAIVDAMGDVFVSAVAKNRGVPKDTVLSDFGQGGVLVGKDAVSAGLADRVGTYEDVLNQLQSGSYRPPKNKAAAKAPAKSQEHSMSLYDDLLAFLKGRVEEGAEDSATVEPEAAVVATESASVDAAVAARVRAAEDRVAAANAEAARIEAEALRLRVENICNALTGTFTPAAMEPAEDGSKPLEAFVSALAASDPALLDSFEAFAETLPKSDATEQVETLGQVEGGVTIVSDDGAKKKDIKAIVRARVRDRNKASRLAGKENN